MNWGDGQVASVPSSPDAKASLRQDPLRRKVMSALASLVDKHRRLLEEHDQVVITICLDWRQGEVRETVISLPVRRRIVSRE